MTVQQSNSVASRWAIGILGFFASLYTGLMLSPEAGIWLLLIFTTALVYSRPLLLKGTVDSPRWALTSSLYVGWFWCVSFGLTTIQLVSRPLAGVSEIAEIVYIGITSSHAIAFAMSTLLLTRLRNTRTNDDRSVD